MRTRSLCRLVLTTQASYFTMALERVIFLDTLDHSRSLQERSSVPCLSIRLLEKRRTIA